MTKNWQIKKLGEVCEIKPPKKEARANLADNDFVSFVPMEDLGILTKEFIATQKRQLKEVFRSYTFFSDNDVLLAKITPCFENGKLGIAHNLINGIGFGSSEFIVFRSKGDVIPDFIFYFLSANEFREKGKNNMFGAVGHKRVSKEFIDNYPIPLPPLSEQKRIVKILDEVFAGINKAKENAEKNLQNARELFESYLQNIFSNPGSGWKEKKLGEVCIVLMGQSPSGDTYNSSGEGVPLINGPVEFGPDPFSKTIKSKYTTAPTKFCQKGDLILCVRGSTTGRINIAGFKACIGRGVAAVRCSENQSWINYFILAKRNTIYKLGTGSTFPNVSADIIKSLPVVIPPLSTQRAIVAKLDALSAETKKLEAIYQKKLDNLEELKKSVLKKAFSGEL